MPYSRPLEARRVLYWIYAGRLVIALAVFGSALLVGEGWGGGGLTLQQRVVSFVGLGMAAILTPIAYWYSHWWRQPGRGFVYLQALLDSLLVTGTVHITGGSESVFPPLFYIAAASGYALLLPFIPAVLIAVFMGVLYLLDVAVAYPEQLDIPVLLQIAIFTAVASVASVVGAQSRNTRERLRSVEGELRRLRVDTTDILRTIISGVVNFDAGGRVAYMNPAAGELLGLQPEEWLGRDLLNPLRIHAPEVAVAVVETLETGDAIRNREVEMIQQPLLGVSPVPEDGRAAIEALVELEPLPEGAIVVPLAMSTTALHAPGDRTSATLVMQDLRVVRQLEDLRLQTERLEAVAELSASLAHEIRNPLASIKSAAEQLGARAREDDDDRMLSRLMTREADRLDRLLAEFSDFARVDISRRQTIEVRALIDEAVSIVRQHPDFGTASVTVRMEAELDDLWGDPDLLHRVLVNLVLNAAQVGSAKPDLHIQIVVDALRPALVPPDVSLGRPVRIRVIDNGPGIPAADLERIFDPFYTRRAGGTGLGLSIARRAVHAHGGALMATSVSGNGATFVLVLPRRESGERRRRLRDGQVDRRDGNHPAAAPPGHGYGGEPDVLVGRVDAV